MRMRLPRAKTTFQQTINELIVGFQDGSIILEEHEVANVSASELLAECDALVLQCNAVAAAPMAGGLNPLALLALVRKVRDLVASLAALAGNPDVLALLESAKAIIAEIRALFGGDDPTPEPDNGGVV